MPISGPSFFPTFKALGGGAPDVTVPITQLCFDTSAGPPYQGWVWNYSIATWERFGGAGGGGFPTTENINSTHAGVTLGNKNVSYITTDGTGTVNNVKLPIPAPDAGTLNAFWNTQWHVVVLKTRTNAADTVAIDPRTVTVTNSAFFDDVNEFYKAPEYLNSTIILGAAGDMAAFKWNGGQWVFDPDSVTDLSTVTPKVNTNADIGIYGGAGNSYSKGGQGVFIAGGTTTYGTPYTGGYVQLKAGDATTGAGGFLRFKGGYSTTQGGNASIYGGYTGGAAASHGGKISLHGGYGYTGGDIYARTGEGAGAFGTIGSINLLTPNAPTNNITGGGIYLSTGNGLGASGGVGQISLQTGQADSNANAGLITLTTLGVATGTGLANGVRIETGGGSAPASATKRSVGDILLQTGFPGAPLSSGLKGGNIIIQTDDSDGTANNTGHVIIGTGGVLGGGSPGRIILATGTNPFLIGTSSDPTYDGNINLAALGTLQLEAHSEVLIGPDAGGNLVTRNLPIADPAVAGALWSNNGIISLSGGGTSGAFSGGVTVGTAAEMISSNVAFTNGAGAGAGTLTNAPAAGNPTKWIGVNDNGTLRHVPAW